jgi:hypothetical protein
LSKCATLIFNVLEARDTAARNAAGWTVCLAELDKHLRGAVAEGPHSDTAEPWREHYDAYIADGMPYGAEILARKLRRINDRAPADVSPVRIVLVPLRTPFRFPPSGF